MSTAGIPRPRSGYPAPPVRLDAAQLAVDHLLDATDCYCPDHRQMRRLDATMGRAAERTTR